MFVYCFFEPQFMVLSHIPNGTINSCNIFKFFCDYRHGKLRKVKIKEIKKCIRIKKENIAHFLHMLKRFCKLMRNTHTNDNVLFMNT